MQLAHQVAVGFGETMAFALGVVTWAGFVLIYHRGWRRSLDVRRMHLLAFAVGTGLVIAVTSPLFEHLAEDLVSMHMVQHVALLLLAGPAIAVSRPGGTLLRGLSHRWRKKIGHWRRSAHLTPSTTGALTRPMLVWLLYGLAVWFWHGSGPYELAAASTWAHLIEHVMFLGAAIVFWSVVLAPRRESVSAGYRLLMVFTTAFHSVLLAALLTFSDTVWYPSYFASTVSLGLDPLSDQQLAGILMWIPGGLVYTGAGLWLLIEWLRTADPADAGRRDSVPANAD